MRTRGEARIAGFGDDRRIERLIRFAGTLLVALVAGAEHASAQNNVLVILADDVGVDKTRFMSSGPQSLGAVSVPPTPNIDALAYGGLVFRNAYSNVACSSTRALLQTGRYAGRTGIGSIVNPDQGMFALGRNEITLPEMLNLDPAVARFSTAVFGKWHLGSTAVGGPLAPNVAGYEHAECMLGNLGIGQKSYYEFDVVVDGTVEAVQNYATSETVARALSWIETAPEPWHVLVSFNAAHNPWHAPPWNLHQQPLPSGCPPRTCPEPFYNATVTAMDTEIGVLLNGLADVRDHTDIFFMGDNGTPKEASVPPFLPAHAKLSPYAGGVHVPMIVNGPSVVQPGRDTAAIVSVADVFATIAELSGVDLATHFPANVTLDSVSLVPYLTDPNQAPLRSTVYSERFIPNGDVNTAISHWQLIRNDRYRLVRRVGMGASADELYDLLLDPFETNDLLAGTPSAEQQSNYHQLSEALVNLVATF